MHWMHQYFEKSDVFNKRLKLKFQTDGWGLTVKAHQPYVLSQYCGMPS